MKRTEVFFDPHPKWKLRRWTGTPTAPRLCLWIQSANPPGLIEDWWSVLLGGTSLDVIRLKFKFKMIRVSCGSRNVGNMSFAGVGVRTMFSCSFFGTKSRRWKVAATKHNTQFVKLLADISTIFQHLLWMQVEWKYRNKISSQKCVSGAPRAVLLIYHTVPSKCGICCKYM